MTLLVGAPLLLRAADEDRLTTLENNVASLQAILETNNQRVAEALATLGEIRTAFQELKGSVDETRYYLGENKKENQLVLDDMDRRLSQLEDKVALFTSQLEDLSAAQGGEQKKDPVSLYRNGLHEMNRQDYKKAIGFFESFLKEKTKGDLADKAQYWIGEAHLGLKNYPQAITEFQKVVTQYPLSPKVSAALFKQGVALQELKSYPEAEAFFQKLMAKYPHSKESLRAEEHLKQIRLLMQQTPQTLQNPQTP